jgi:hypothetical protein
LSTGAAIRVGRNIDTLPVTYDDQRKIDEDLVLTPSAAIE